MKKIWSLVSLLVLVSGVAGCSSSAPGCDASETTDLVMEIVREEIANIYGPGMAEQVGLDLDAIRTTDVNDKTGSRECAAVLAMDAPSGESEIDITYVSELTDEAGEFYVTVYGL